MAHLHGAAEYSLGTGHVNECLIKGKRFDHRREIAEHFHDTGRQGLVALESWRHEYTLRTTPGSLHRRHGAFDPVGPRFITSGQHHAAPAAWPDNHRLPAQRGIVQLLNRCIKCIHVRVRNDTRPAHTLLY